MSRMASALWVLLGLSAGLALGLAVAWLDLDRAPPAYNRPGPHAPDVHQQDYVLMVSVAYEQER